VDLAPLLSLFGGFGSSSRPSGECPASIPSYPDPVASTNLDNNSSSVDYVYSSNSQWKLPMPFANMGNLDPEQVHKRKAILDGIKANANKKLEAVVNFCDEDTTNQKPIISLLEEEGMSIACFLCTSDMILTFACTFHTLQMWELPYKECMDELRPAV
jgi:hypothetical protein